jgi:hypothetical protein
MPTRTRNSTTPNSTSSNPTEDEAISDKQNNTTVLLTQNFGNPITELNYKNVESVVNFYKKQRIAGKNFKVIDLINDYARFQAYNKLYAGKFIGPDITYEMFGESLESEVIVNALKLAFPKQEHRGVGAAELAQKSTFQLFPGKEELITEVIYPIFNKIKEEKLTLEQEQAIVGILTENLDNKTEGASNGYIYQFRNEIKEKSPKTVLEFQTTLSTVHARIDGEIDTFKNSYEATVTFKNQYMDDSHIGKKQRTNGGSGGSNSNYLNKQSNSDNKTSSDKKNLGAGAENSNRKTCSACGLLGHEAGKYKCVFVFANHPDYNKQFHMSFAESEKGKAYFSKFKKLHLTNQQTTGGYFDFVKEKNNLNEAIATKNKKGNNLFNLNHNNNEHNNNILKYTLKCSAHLYNDSLSYHILTNILIDTCALQANYVSTKLINKLGEESIIQNNINQPVCSVGSCVSCSRLAKFYITFLNTFNKLFETIEIIAYVLPKLDVDLIIGRPSIKKYNLLSKTPLENVEYTIPKNVKLLNHNLLLKTSNELPTTENNLHDSHELCYMCENTILRIGSKEYNDHLRSQSEDLYYTSTTKSDVLSISSIEHTQTDYEREESKYYNYHYNLGPSNYLDSNNLHQIFKISFSDIGEDSPYKIRRIPKSEIFDPIPDNDYIDYNKNIPPWEEIKNNETFEFKFGEEAKPNEKETVLNILNEYKYIFNSKLIRGPAKITPLELVVDKSKWEVKENRQPARIFSKEKNLIIGELVKDQLAYNIIQPSQANEVSQVVVVKKPDNTYRGCIDYIKLNLATKSLGWRIPNIQQLIHRIGSFKPKYMGKFDFTSGYYQAPLHPNSWAYTAFTTWMGNFEYKTLPMGIKGAPSWFQQVLSTEVLYDLIYRICELYMDDLIFWGNTLEEYNTNLKLILDRFVKYNITPSPKKCVFLQEKIEYLGYTLDRDGISFSEKKIAGALEIELPKTLKKLKQYVGVSVHFSRHIENYSEKARLLNKKLGNYNNAKNKHAKLYWNEEEIVAFQNMKRAIENCQKLHFIKDEHEIYLQTDASDYGIAGYLFQIINGVEYPVMFVSKALQNEQLNWNIEEKEQYAIVYSLEKMEFLLRDVKFIIRTDHENLIRINFGKSKKVLRWKLYVQEFDFDLEFIEGDKNIIPDAFSRLTPDNNIIENHELNLFENVTIPSDKFIIIESVHNQTIGHHGVDRTFNKLVANGHNWLYMKNHVKKFIRLCACCQKMSYLKPTIISHPFTIGSYEPMERIAIDTIGPLPTDELGFAYIIVLICCFSRYTTLHVAKDATALSAAEAIINHTAIFGVPSQLLSDMGTQYINEIIDQLTFMMGIQKLDTMPGIHEENSIVERRNKEIGEHLRDILFHKKVKNKWSRVIPLVQRIVNAEWVESTSVSPAQIIFGNSIDLDRNLFLKNKPDIKDAKNLPDSITTKSLSTWISDMLNYQKEIIEIAQNSQRALHLKYYNKTCDKIPTNFAIGSYVLVRNNSKTKIDQMWNGPYRIVGQDSINKNRFSVQNLITGKVEDFPNKYIKQFVYDENYTNPEDVALTDEQYFIVDKILAHKPAGKNLTISTSKNKIKFQVLYKGEKDPIWVEYATLRDNEILHKYLTTNKLVRLIPSKYKWGRDGPTNI